MTVIQPGGPTGQPQEPAGPSVPGGGAHRTHLGIAAVASAGAGLVHAAAAGTHNGDRTLALLFAACAVAQIGWAAVALMRPRRATALAGIAVNGAAVAAWVLSRTVGI